MEINRVFGKALQTIRKIRGLQTFPTPQAELI